MRSGFLKGVCMFALAAAVFCLTLSGCRRSGEDGGAEVPAEAGHPLKVVTTLFPYYDFTRQIAGENIELSMVIPAGMDSHSFEPTPADIRLIEEADLFICNGGHMEQWVSQVLSSLDTPSMTVVTMMDHVDVVEEEIVEGMEVSGHEHEHGHDEDGEDGHDAEDESLYEIEYDEHIWTSPANAMEIVKVISAALKEADPEHAKDYEAGAEAYLAKLSKLDAEFAGVVAEAKRDIMIFGDKFPLRYFADEYGLRYRAAFSGCSTDTEPSAKTIAYLIDKVREKHIPAVYYLELSSSRVAEIIGEETGAEPLLFHSCHNVTRREFDAGVTYLELMETNVKNLRKGLCE